MQANELRIGNFIQDKKHKWILSVDIIQSHFIAASFKHCLSQNPIEDYEPIHLTPEILEKAGFTWMQFKGGQRFALDTLKGCTINFYPHYCRAVVGEKYFGSEVHFVHQLQNLYFALTSEELIIDL